uniref:DDE Tnp4 domain-containing protein n=1 Tax=Cyprinus carpio TaxID=7962 RepID=A0A8C1Z6F8_CYPCA
MCFLLFTGESFRSLSYLFRVGVSTNRQFIPETCSAIYQVLKDKYLKVCDHKPTCVLRCDFFLYFSHSFSVVLMALVDSSYRFLYVDGGCNGRISDGGVFGGCSLQNALENRTVNIPAPAPLPGSDQLAPYCIVADEAFPLKEYLMKPYPNRRLSVQVVENAFGILANRFRTFLNTINIQDTAKVEDIVLACCALHNFLRAECGEWRQDPDLLQAPLPYTTNTTTRAKRSRDELCQYFISEIGAVPFQWSKI